MVLAGGEDIEAYFFCLERDFRNIADSLRLRRGFARRWIGGDVSDRKDAELQDIPFYP